MIGGPSNEDTATNDTTVGLFIPLDLSTSDIHCPTVPAPLPMELRLTAKELYLQGFKPEAIANKLGLSNLTVQSWVAKRHWKSDRDKLVNAVAMTGQRCLESSPDGLIRQTSSRVKSRLANTLDKSSAVLDTLPVNARTLDKRLETARRLAVVADPVFGWSAEAQGPTHVSLTKIDVRPACRDGQGQVIDVPYE